MVQSAGRWFVGDFPFLECKSFVYDPPSGLQVMLGALAMSFTQNATAYARMKVFPSDKDPEDVAFLWLPYSLVQPKDEPQKKFIPNVV